MKRRISKPGKGMVFLGNRLKQVLLFCLIPAMVGCLSERPPGKTAGEIIAVIERDALQTRNFVPVINHDTMIVNLTPETMTIEIHSAIPPGKYLKDSPYSAFGTDSLLGGPMFAPFSLPIKGHIILEKPKVNRTDKGVSYYWDNVVLPSGQAVRAQYDNYYGPTSDFYFNHVMNISGLDIKSDYKVKVEKEERGEILYQLGLHLTLENAGGQDVVEMFFRVFVPFALALEDKGDLHFLVEPVDIRFSDNLKVTTISLVDGFGNAARGVEASVPIGTLKPGGTFSCVLQIDCTQKAKEGEIYPVMTILGRRQLVRAWPATIVKRVPPGTQKKFHYLLYNLVIGARRIFHINKRGITVIMAENLKQARFQ